MNNTNDYISEELKRMRLKMTEQDAIIKSLTLKLEEYMDIIDGLRARLNVARIPVEGVVN